MPDSGDKVDVKELKKRIDEFQAESDELRGTRGPLADHVKERVPNSPQFLVKFTISTDFSSLASWVHCRYQSE